jgi:hypothetical protein
MTRRFQQTWSTAGVETNLTVSMLTVSGKLG